MSTLGDPAVRANCRVRLEKLRPEMQPTWGQMTAPQMICHLTDSFQASTGQRSVTPNSSFLQRTLIKWLAIRTPMKWPKGVPTTPEVQAGVGGTPPGPWKDDQAKLFHSIEEFAAHDSFGPHPLFGHMSRKDWLTWGYRHVDHHCRQFGV